MMKTLLKISWRNIWRNRVRSFVIIGAIIVGLMGGIFSAAIRLAAEMQQYEEAVENRTSHIQLHHPNFIANPEPRFNIENGLSIAKELNNLSSVKISSARNVFDGMIASANLNSGVRIKGIDPVTEAKTTKLNELISEGSYFENQGRLPSVIIGSALSREINVSVGSRIILTFQDINGEMVSSSFTVEGIFSVTSRRFEETTVFVNYEDLNNLVGKENLVTEIAVVIHDSDSYRIVAEKIQELYPNTEVRHWAEIDPALYYALEFLNKNLVWMVGIIILGISFGLLNTMLMSVLERVKELGVLMAVGMDKVRVFLMVVTEATLLSLIAGVIGLFLSYLMISYFSVRGIDLSGVGAEGLEEFGYATMLYLHIDPAFYLKIGLLVVFYAIVASIYPAFKAVRLSPVEAVRQD